MKTIIISILLFTSNLVFFSSCKQGSEVEVTPVNTDFSELVIKTDLNPIDNFLRSGPVSNFTQGSQLGLFITKGDLGNNYSAALSQNVKSTFTGTSWVQTPPVNLYNYPTVIYAYYPYIQSVADGEDIFIQSGVTDFMFGTHTSGQEAINKDNSIVNLTMKHALALVQFNIYKTAYSWKGRLDRIGIANANGKSIVYANGRMNIQTGEIKNLSGADRNIGISSTPLMYIPDNKSGDESTYMKILMIPTQEVISKEGDVIISFDIDQKEYLWELPAGTIWKQGTKYTYDVQLIGNELRIGDVKISEWLDGVNEDIILE